MPTTARQEELDRRVRELFPELSEDRKRELDARVALLSPRGGRIPRGTSHESLGALTIELADQPEAEGRATLFEHEKRTPFYKDATAKLVEGTSGLLREAATLFTPVPTGNPQIDLLSLGVQGSMNQFADYLEGRSVSLYELGETKDRLRAAAKNPKLSPVERTRASIAASIGDIVTAPAELTATGITGLGGAWGWIDNAYTRVVLEGVGRNAGLLARSIKEPEALQLMKMPKVEEIFTTDPTKFKFAGQALDDAMREFTGRGFEERMGPQGRGFRLLLDFAVSPVNFYGAKTTRGTRAGQLASHLEQPRVQNIRRVANGFEALDAQGRTIPIDMSAVGRDATLIKANSPLGRTLDEIFPDEREIALPAELKAKLIDENRLFQTPEGVYRQKYTPSVPKLKEGRKNILDPRNLEMQEIHPWVSEALDVPLDWFTSTSFYEAVRRNFSKYPVQRDETGQSKLTEIWNGITREQQDLTLEMKIRRAREIEDGIRRYADETGMTFEEADKYFGRLMEDGLPPEAVGPKGGGGPERPEGTQEILPEPGPEIQTKPQEAPGAPAAVQAVETPPKAVEAAPESVQATERAVVKASDGRTFSRREDGKFVLYDPETGKTSRQPIRKPELVAELEGKAVSGVDRTAEGKVLRVQPEGETTGRPVFDEGRGDEAAAAGRALQGEGVAKEPWEMTKAEISAEGMPYDEYRIAAWEDLTQKQKAVAKQKFQKETGDFDEAERGWENYAYDVKTLDVITDDNTTHKWVVEQALRDGKPVPAEVLKDYPELQPKPAAKPTAKAAAGRALQEEGVAKEPWEIRTAMDSFGIELKTPEEMAARYKGMTEGEGAPAWSITKQEFLDWPVRSMRKKGLTRNAQAGVLSSQRASWEERTVTWEDVHRTEVEIALREGKPVPAEVLKDYPDLQPKPAPKVAEVDITEAAFDNPEAVQVLIKERGFPEVLRMADDADRTFAEPEPGEKTVRQAVTEIYDRMDLAGTEPLRFEAGPAVAPAKAAEAGRVAQGAPDEVKARRPSEGIGRSPEAQAARVSQEEVAATRRAEMKDIDGFGDNLSTVQRGHIIQTLEKKQNYNGKLMRRKDFIRQAVGEGRYVGERPNGKRVLFSADGETWLELTKTELDYADYLAKRESGGVEIISPEQAYDWLKAKTPEVKAAVAAREKLPAVNEPIGTVEYGNGDLWEYALIAKKDHGYGIGMRRLGSTGEFESGGYGFRKTKEGALINFGEREGSRAKEMHPISEKAFKEMEAERVRVESEAAAERATKEERTRTHQEKVREYTAYLDKKPLKGTKGKIKVQTGDGVKEKEVAIYGPLAIGKDYGGYNITHIDSGLSLGKPFSSLQQARRMIRAIRDRGIDFSFKGTNTPKGLGEEIKMLRGAVKEPFYNLEIEIPKIGEKAPLALRGEEIPRTREGQYATRNLTPERVVNTNFDPADRVAIFSRITEGANTPARFAKQVGVTKAAAESLFADLELGGAIRKEGGKWKVNDITAKADFPLTPEARDLLESEIRNLERYKEEERILSSIKTYFHREVLEPSVEAFRIMGERNLKQDLPYIAEHGLTGPQMVRLEGMGINPSAFVKWVEREGPGEVLKAIEEQQIPGAVRGRNYDPARLKRVNLKRELRRAVNTSSSKTRKLLRDMKMHEINALSEVEGRVWGVVPAERGLTAGQVQKKWGIDVPAKRGVRYMPERFNEHFHLDDSGNFKDYYPYRGPIYKAEFLSASVKRGIDNASRGPAIRGVERITKEFGMPEADWKNLPKGEKGKFVKLEFEGAQVLNDIVKDHRFPKEIAGYMRDLFREMHSVHEWARKIEAGELDTPLPKIMRAFDEGNAFLRRHVLVSPKYLFYNSIGNKLNNMLRDVTARDYGDAYQTTPVIEWGDTPIKGVGDRDVIRKNAFGQDMSSRSVLKEYMVLEGDVIAKKGGLAWEQRRLGEDNSVIWDTIKGAWDKAKEQGRVSPEMVPLVEGGMKAVEAAGRIIEIPPKIVFALNNWIELQDRFALYWSQRLKGASPRDAFRTVLETLFDYHQMPPRERKLARWIFFWCVPEDCEILTERGWLKYPELKKGEDRIAVYDHKEGASRFEILKNYETFPHDGQLLTMSNRRFGTFSFTPDHTWPVFDSNGARKLVKGYQLTSAQSIPLVADRHIWPEESALTEREAEILGWVLTDGTLSKNGHNISIYQKKEPFVTELRALLGDEAGESIHPDTGVINFSLRNPIRKRIWEIVSSKQEALNLLPLLNKRTAEIMRDAMYKADGSTAPVKLEKHRTQRFFAQRHPNNWAVRDLFQILSTLLGVPANLTANGRGMYLRTSKTTTINRERGIEWYKGIVWCPELGGKCWYMRRNGKVILTGNTWARQNTSLQLREFVRQPWRYRAVEYTGLAVETDSTPGGMGIIPRFLGLEQIEKPEKTDVAEWQEYVPENGWLLGGFDRNGERYAVYMLPGYGAPQIEGLQGIRKLLWPDIKPWQKDDNLTKFVARTRNLARMAVPSVTYPAERFLNYNLFSGSRITHGEWERESFMGKWDIPPETAYDIKSPLNPLGLGRVVSDVNRLIGDPTNPDERPLSQRVSTYVGPTIVSVRLNPPKFGGKDFWLQTLVDRQIRLTPETVEWHRVNNQIALYTHYREKKNQEALDKLIKQLEADAEQEGY